MKNQLTTTTHQTAYNGGNMPTVDKVIIHTATSCYLIQNVFTTVTGEHAIHNANLIIGMHKAIQQAKSFIQGFEGDESQTGINELLEKLNQFDVD